jgi:hypothetical protein
VLARVLRNLEAAVVGGGQACTLLYYMPVLASLIDRETWLCPHSAARDWAIYQSP